MPPRSKWAGYKTVFGLLRARFTLAIGTIGDTFERPLRWCLSTGTRGDRIDKRDKIWPPIFILSFFAVILSAIPFSGTHTPHGHPTIAGWGSPPRARRTCASYRANRSRRLCRGPEIVKKVLLYWLLLQLKKPRGSNHFLLLSTVTACTKQPIARLMLKSEMRVMSWKIWGPRPILKLVRRREERKDAIWNLLGPKIVPLWRYLTQIFCFK